MIVLLKCFVHEKKDENETDSLQINKIDTHSHALSYNFDLQLPKML